MLEGVIYFIAVIILCTTLFLALKFIYKKEDKKEQEIKEYRKKVLELLEALSNEKTNNE